MTRRRTSAPAKAPAYQWYPKDHALDEVESTLENEAYGLWRRLYDTAWLNDGLPDDLDRIFLLSKCPDRARFDQLWAAIAPLFPPDGGGRRRNPGQERQRRQQRKNSKLKQLAAAKRWSHERGARNAHAYACASPSASHVQMQVQCLALALPLALPDHRAGEQRALPARAASVRMTFSLWELRNTVLAAVHRLLDVGAPYVDATGAPNLPELTEAVKTIAARDLGCHWDSPREIHAVIDAVLARRRSLALAGVRRERFQQRERRSLARLGGVR